MTNKVGVSAFAGIAVGAWLVAATAGAGASSGQPAQPRFRSGVEVVEVAVVARDLSGRPVTDLTRADLTILEQGVVQNIVGFERVSVPAVPVPPRREVLPADVSSNEALADSRVFVLVLDALHVAPDRNRSVRDYARQFVERVVGPSDLTAVFSPGAAATATADFTSDKARVLAAIDSFTGTKLPSATVERDKEQRQFYSGVPVHAGKDPDDGERANRAYSLTNVLEALARHLDRIEGRRKALLLFSEGIDYDTGDVMGDAQRYASEVTHAMDRAVGALARTNVALYTIDPRVLGSIQGDLIQTPVYQPEPSRPGALSEQGVEAEFRNSVYSLRHFAESTGGFLASDRGIARAFDQIAQESSEYYIARYTPSRPARPGESRTIAVRSSRAGVTLVARKGYVVPRAEARRTAIEPAVEAAGPAMPGGPRGRSSPFGPASAPIASPVPSAAPADGVATGLAELLSSPLPKAGLPLRVQAIPFHADGRRRAVHLIVEVLGEGLRFAQGGNRGRERIDIAMMTVDERGRGANGRSTKIDLNLTPEQVARVQATGVRWLSKLELTAGRYQLRVAASAAETGATGMITSEFDVPAVAGDRADISGVTLTSLPAVLMITRGDTWLGKGVQTPPSAARTFVRGDQVTASLVLSVPGRASSALAVTARLEDLNGVAASTTAKKIEAGSGRDRAEDVVFPIDTARLAPGPYVLRVALDDAGVARSPRVVPFEIVEKPRR